MQTRPLNPRLLLLAALLCLAPLAAQARFILTDAVFDNRAAGTDLLRRGALFGEPVTGPFDRQRETIVDQGGGDMAVELDDTQILGPSEMYWNLRDGMTIAGGLLTARIEITPQAVGDYTVALRAADQLTDFLAVDIVDSGSSGRFVWRDADSPTGTFFAFAAAGVAYDLMVELDLNAGTYTLWWNGTAIVTDEPHGLVGQDLGYLVVGHRDDGNAVGSFEYDLIQLDWRPDDSVPDLLAANFNDKPAGEPLQLRGAYYGEPVSVSGVGLPIVESGLPMGNKAMVYADDNASASSTVRFEFFNGAELVDQPVSISFAVSFDELDEYVVYVREQGSSSRTFLNLLFRQGGQVQLTDAASGGSVLASTTYNANTRHVVEMAFENELDVYSVWFDGERLIHRRGHGIADRDVGRVIFGLGNDTDLDGVIRVDRILAHTLGVAVAAPEATPEAPARLLGAAPNPFNPATEVRFELARAGHVTLDIFDSRGLRVRRLVSGHLEAGLHRASWQGRDEAGRQLASGVYHARLESAGGVVTRALTLLK
ncbi:MAG: FlgD immunoglobulin-like domain containing protein [Candidatus Krumholzibacteriia bacterium]